MTTTIFTDLITDESQLRDVFGWPSARSVNKQIDRLDQHCRAIIAKAPSSCWARPIPPVAVMCPPKATTRDSCGCSTTDPRHPRSPRQQSPGYPDQHAAQPQVGLLFMIPGMMRRCGLTAPCAWCGTPCFLASLAFRSKRPKLAIVVDVQEVFSHCPKAFMRSKLWAVESQIDRRSCPPSPKSSGITRPLGNATWTSCNMNSTTERRPCCISVMAEMESRRKVERRWLQVEG